MGLGAGKEAVVKTLKVGGSAILEFKCNSFLLDKMDCSATGG